MDVILTTERIMYIREDNIEANTMNSEHIPQNRMETHLNSPSVTLLLATAIVGAVVYMIFLLQPSYRGDPLPYSIVIVAELFLIIHSIVTFWTILSGRINPRNFGYHSAQDNLFGENSKRTIKKLGKMTLAVTSTQKVIRIHQKPTTIDIFIPVYGEPLEEIKETASAAKAIYGEHKTFILDDGKSDDVALMAKKIGVGYIRRPDNHNAKAGNINYALANTTGEYFIIFDADFVADRHFIVETIPFFEDDRMAFVQTPQYYDNQNNFVSTGANYMQHVFYSLVQVGKNRFNAAFCVGTNVMFRRSAVASIGGMYYQSKSEDIWTSLLLHEKGYHSIYINKVLAIGKTPETIKAYTKQQLRWATGSFEILLKYNPLADKKLTFDQRIQYLATTAFYLNGFAVLGLVLLPALQIYFNLTPISLDIPFYQWAILYSGFYVTQLALSILTIGAFRMETIVLSAVSFPIYIKAFMNALWNRDEVWRATNRKDTFDSPFNYIKVQTYIFIFLLLTMFTGVWKSMYTHEFSISIVWCGLNALIFGCFIYIAVLESRAMKDKSVRTKKQPRTLALKFAPKGRI
jgi:cellulose synthase (UDP-forming)